MKVLFMGTPEFAKISLECLVKNEYNIAGVVTQPDKPAGRKMTLTPSPVKEYASGENIPVYQPQSLKSEDFFDLLKSINPDIIVVVAYGKLIPKNVLDFPKHGCVNVHGSLLPKYRGASPINAAIINGEKITGITTQYMEEGIDTGDMILKESIEIGENETYGELHDKLAQIGGRLLIDTLEQIQGGTVKREKQPDDGASYVGKIDNTMCEIDWNLTAQEIHDKIRGLSPVPAAFTYLNGRKLKIFKSRISDDGIVELLEVQIEGGKRMNARDFANGRKNTESDVREGRLFKFSR
ncbi:methionyl-tRNA formyltransferase [Lacrimispora sp.]|uniref:methionyl-tRNA formyltransferase n=1 Tax=Lacrimispora sp. TaxID=2719234 RepID=UPI0028989680|nr:methionyl-tRNA formyltransferase [Lacrimispora sp.]